MCYYVFIVKLLQFYEYFIVRIVEPVLRAVPVAGRYGTVSYRDLYWFLWNSKLNPPNFAIGSDPYRTQTKSKLGPNRNELSGSGHTILNRTVLVQFGAFLNGPRCGQFFTAKPCWFLAGSVRYAPNLAIWDGLKNPALYFIDISQSMINFNYLMKS